MLTAQAMEAVRHAEGSSDTSHAQDECTCLLVPSCFRLALGCSRSVSVRSKAIDVRSRCQSSKCVGCQRRIAKRLARGSYSSSVYCPTWSGESRVSELTPSTHKARWKQSGRHMCDRVSCRTGDVQCGLTTLGK